MNTIQKNAQTFARRIQCAARSAQKRVTGSLSKLVKRGMVPDWPEGFFEEVVGGWKGEPLQRPPQGEYEQRQDLKSY